jgi:hypothetical protein
MSTIRYAHTIETFAKSRFDPETGPAQFIQLVRYVDQRYTHIMGIGLKPHQCSNVHDAPFNGADVQSGDYANAVYRIYVNQKRPSVKQDFDGIGLFVDAHPLLADEVVDYFNGSIENHEELADRDLPASLQFAIDYLAEEIRARSLVPILK